MIQLFLAVIGAVAALAAEPQRKEPKVVYPRQSNLEFDGTDIDGELKNPAELYFQIKPQEKFGSLMQARKNFHREMLRDAVMTK